MFFILCTHDIVDQPVIKPGTNVTVIAVVTSVLVFILVAAVVTAVVFVVRLKKKYSKKEKQNNVPDHAHESTPLALDPVALYPEPGYEVTATVVKDSSDNGEDQAVEHNDFVSRQNVGEGQIELKENEAYTTFNISAEPICT